MKRRLLAPARLSIPHASALVAALLAVVSGKAQAQTLYYKSTTAANAWTGSFWGTSAAGPFTGAWTSGRAVVFVDNGGTALALTGATTNFSSITANENVNVTAGGTLGTGGTVASITVAAGKNMNFGTQAISTAAGTGFIKNGDGILTIATGGAYTGGFTINAGTMAVGGVNAMGAGGALVINGGTIRSNNTTARDLTGKYTGGITIGGNFTLGDATNNGLLTFTNTVNLGAANRTITANSAATFGGAVGGAAGVGFTKNGAGTLRLNGVNTLTGVVEVAGGLLQIGSYTGLSTAGSLTVSGGGTSNLQLIQVGTGTTVNTINKALSLHGTLSIGGGNATDRLNQTWAGTTTLVGNSTITNNGNSAFIITGGIDLGAHTLTYQADGASSRINGNIIGTGSLIKSSPQDLTLFGTNTYSGTTTVTGGTLRFVTPQTLYGGVDTNWTAANINVQSGATLAFNVGAPNQFTNAQVTTLLTNLAVSNSATEGMNAGSNFAFNTDTAPNFFSIPDVIADSTGLSGGARGLIKQGAASTLVLTGANTYTGATTINGGTLRLENTTATSQITLASSTTILQVGTDTVYSGPRIVSTAGTIVSDRATAGAGLTHVFSGISRLGSGNTNITAGANVTSGTAAIQFASLDNDNGTVANFGLNPTTANVIVTGGVNMGGGANAGEANFTLGGTGSINSIGGNIENGARATGNLIKQGTSTWSLSGANTYNGTTAVNGGLLVLDYSNQDNSKLSDTGALTLGSATLQLSGGSHPETVLSTSLTANTASLVTRSGGTSVLQMNAITRGAGATINFSAPGIATTDTLNTNGILGTWATIEGTDFAANSTDLADGPITAAAYTDLTRLDSGTKVVADGAGTNVRIIEGTGTAAAITLGAAVTNINTLNQSISGGTSAATIDSGGQALRTNAILAGPTAGLLTIGNGTLATATAGGELLLISNSTNGITINSAISDNTSASSLTKQGSGLVTLGAANGYTGTTTIDHGTLKFSANQTLTGALNFGSSTISTLAGALDLTDASASFPSLNVQSNSPASITIGSGQTLTLTGSTVANVLSVGTTTLPGLSRLVVTGAGTLTVTDATRNIVVSNPSGANGATNISSQMDLSGLGSFNATIANIYVGRPTLASGAAQTAFGRPNTDVLTLAAANNITASGVIAVGGSTSSFGATTATPARLLLGTTNNLNAASFVIGSSRISGEMEFNTGLTTPTATLRGATGGTSRTDIYLGDQANTRGVASGGGGSSAILGTMDFSGGSVDARVENLFVGMGGTVTSNIRARGDGSFTMDGALSNVDVNTLVIGQNISDNTAHTGNPIATSSTGTFTVTNGTLQVNTAMTIANDLDTTATANGTQNVQGTFTVAGGTANIGVTGTPVNMILGNHVNAGNPGLATAAVNLTGGTLNVIGNIQEGNLGGGTITSSLSINGASAILDMKGGNITNLDTITYTDGTLRNLGTVNTGVTLAGTGSRVFDQDDTILGTIQGVIAGPGVGLTNQGLGELTLSAPNTYDGATTIDGGHLNVTNLQDGGIASSIGNSTAAASNLVLKNGATLHYTGGAAPAASTDRLFTLGTGDNEIRSSGSGGITFSNTGAIATTDSGARTLSLRAATAGATNTLASVIADGAGGETQVHKHGAGTWVLTGPSTFTGRTLINAGTLSISARENLGDVGTGKHIDFNGGTLQTTASMTFNTRIFDLGVNGGTFDVAPGTTLTTGFSTGKIQGSGSLTKIGAGTLALNGTNTYTGPTVISGGTLLVNGNQSLATGAVSVASGATLGGSGTLGGLVTTGGVGSFLSPGNSPGTLILNGGLDASAGATFNMEVGTPATDVIVIGGTFTGSTAAGALLWNLSDAGGLLPSTPYSLLTFAASTGLDYTDLAVGTLGAGLTLDPAFGTGGFLINSNNLQVQFSAVPEPTTPVTLLAGLGFLLGRRRRA